MSPPARLASLPKTTHPGGVDTNGRGTVFHPLNGSGARRITGRSNASRRKQEGYPKVPHPRDTITAQIQRPVVPYLSIIFTGLPFLFRSPEPLFLLLGKRKSGFTRKGYAPSVRWQSRQRLGCGPSWAGKKVIFPARATPPSVRRHSTHRARAVSKRHSHQETACRHRPIRSPGPAGKYTNVKTHPPIQNQLRNPPPTPFLPLPSSPIGNSFPSRTKQEIFIHPNATKLYIPVHIGPFSP